MMNAMEPEHRLVFVAGLEEAEVLLASAKSISAGLAHVHCNLSAALVTPKVVSDRLHPTVASPLPSTWEAPWPTTFFILTPRI